MAFVSLLEGLPDHLGAAFSPDFLLQTANTFADHAGQSKELATARIIPVLEGVGIHCRDDELRGALAASALTGMSSLDFSEFCAMLIVLLETLESEESSIHSELPVKASTVAWQLVTLTSPLVVKESATHLSKLSHSADIDARTEIAEFESRLSNVLNQGQTPKKRATGSQIMEWTDEIPLLEKLKRDHPTRIWSRDEIAPLFRTLRLCDCGVTILDSKLADFSSLTTLDVSSNALLDVSRLPRGLVGLTANSNCIRSFEDTMRAPLLRYLSLAYNGCCEVPKGLSPKLFPSLRALDLSGNELCELDATLEALSGIVTLSHLCMVGNPVTLLPAYRARVLYGLPDLSQLDDLSVDQPAPSADDPPHPLSLMFLRCTVLSVTGLPVPNQDEEGEAGMFEFSGRLELTVLDTKASTDKDLPWSSNLVSDKPAPVPDDAPAPETTKEAKGKKGKGSIVAPTPVAASDFVAAAEPQQITVRMEPGAALVRHLALGAIKISVFRVRRLKEGDGSNEEAEEEVGSVAVSARAFLEPLMFSRSTCVIHERVTLASCGAEMRLELQLNPEELVSELLAKE
mmetsp:Transcript_78443/g.156923  ORF Transcript_78443/g.156923 Transcript_78443/m.156923 type:complete len:572 (-) Transcript_78443:316-2031(-)|eukprot:CAMPEP_0171702950 /NCGR_PEP_ID=MMETSP0991-20121206/11873_1 /TAXON_ID=483369 /ORGANISM="non described non described, Strain CCMP2098" /LENGTH=571 /DNA_ID=CAMNT_0012292335 /DNA_START=62 /DNA_END=1777 /DNA_ORIENTATION=-